MFKSTQILNDISETLRGLASTLHDGENDRRTFNLQVKGILYEAQQNRCTRSMVDDVSNRVSAQLVTINNQGKQIDRLISVGQTLAKKCQELDAALTEAKKHISDVSARINFPLYENRSEAGLRTPVTPVRRERS